MEDEVVEEFASSLRELNTNSKPLINMLTMLAEDNEQYASHIVQVIESHMNEESQRMKLPCLYLIDSIIKNLPSSTYRSLFAHNIVSVFCDMFEKVDEKTRQCMFKVRQTWNDIFPNRKLYAIDVRVNLVDPAWPITAQPPVEPGSIHVNPRFITAKPPVADSPPVSDSPILEEPEDQEAILRQQIIEKQQEFLKLQQKQLELELEQLKQNKHHLGDTHSNVAVTVDSSSLDSSSPSVPVASTSTSAPVSTTAVIPKDPRMRDPRLRGQSLMPKVTASDASSVPSSFPLPTSAEQAPLPHREFPNAQNYMGFGHHHGPIHNTTHNEMPSWKNTFGHHHAPNSHPGRAGQGLLPFPSSSHPNSEFHPGWDRNNQAFTSARGRGRMHDTDQRSRKNDGKPSHSSSLGSGGKGSFRKDPRLERNDSSSGKKSISPKNKSEASKDTSSKTDVSSKSPSKSSSSKSLEKRHDAHPKKGKDIDASSKKEENVTKNQKSSNTKSSQKKGSTSSHGDLKSSKKSSKDSTENKRKSSSKDDPEKEGKKVSKSSSSSSTTSTSSSKSTSKGKSHSKHSSMERSPSPKKSKTETERKESPEKSVTDVKVEGKNKTGKNDTENEVKMDAVEENKGKRRLSGSDTGVSDDEKSVAKKAKVEESSVSDDITDLFGMEDQDYRSGPSIPAKSPFHQKWAEFRQENPDEFTYEIEHEKSKESLVGEKGASMEEDVDLRSNISASMLQEEIRKVEIPDALTMEHRMDIMQQIEERRRSGELSHEQHQEILRQLAQLDEIQKKQRYFSQLSEGKASNQDTDDRKHPPEKTQSNFSGIHSEDSRTFFDGKLEKPNVTVSENSMDGMKHNTQISHVKMEPHNEKGRFQKGFEHRDNEDNSRDRFPKKEWQDSDYDTRRQHENFPDRHKGFEDRRSSPSDGPYMSDNRREPPREFERNVPKEFEDRRYNVQHRYREDPGEFNERHGPPPRNYAPHDQVRDYDDRARHSWGSSGGEFKDIRPPRDFQPKDGRNNFEERPPFPRDFREGGGFHNRDNFDRGHGPHGFGGPEFDHRNKTNFPNYARGNDPRWFRVVGMLGPEDTEEFVINGRPYEIIVGKPARRIKLGQMTIEVYADPNARAIRVDGRIVYNFGDFVQSVPIRGINYKVFYHGKPRLVWIDGILHELRVDAPPKIIKVKDKEHIVKIDGRDNMILIDKNEVGKFGGPPIYAFIDNSRVELRFEAPPRKILIDGKMCELKLNCKIPCVMINGKPHGIRFEGPPRDIIINGVPYRVHMERPAKVRINGKPIYVAFGGPAHEVIMDGRWFEVKFNGPAKEVNIGNRTFKVELHGPPPGVKILNELTPPEPEPVHDAPNVPPRAVPMPPFSGAPGFRPSGPPPRMPDNMPVFGTNVMQSDPRLPLGGPVMNPVLMNQPGLLPLPQPQGSVGMPMQLMSASANVGMNTTAATTMPNPQIISTSHVNIPSNQPGMLPNFGNVFMNPNPAPAANNAPPLDVSTLLKRLMETGVIKTSSEKPADTPSQAPAAPADTQDTQEKPEFEIKPKKLDPVPNLKDFRLETLRKRYEGVIQQLYSGIQCQSCGLRFTAQQTNKYREHLDWHFRQNKRDKADAKVTRFRRWYYQISDWTEYEEIDESEDKGKSDVFEKIMAATGLASKSQTQAPQQSQAPEMPVFGPDAVHCPPATGDENGDICEICKDPFEQFWNEEEEEWHLKDAVRVDGKTYHPVCYEDEHEGGITETSPTPTPSTSGGVNPLILQIQQELGEVPSTQRIDWSSVREIKTARVIEDDADDLVQNETPEVKPELKVEEIKSEVENGTTEQSASPTENESDGKECSNITVSAVTIKTEIDLDNIKKEPEAEAS